MNFGGRLLEEGRNGLGEVVGLKETRVPESHVVEPFRDASVLRRVRSTFFVPWTTRGEFAAISSSETLCSLHRRSCVRRGLSFTRPISFARSARDVLAGVSELGEVPGSDDRRQALKAAQVGDYRHLRLADREDRSALATRMSHALIRSTPPPMQYPCTAATTGFGTVGDRGDRGLHALDAEPGGSGRGRSRVARLGSNRATAEIAPIAFRSSPTLK